MVLSFSKDNFGKFHQDLPLLQLYEGLKIGVFLHKNVRRWHFICKNKNYTKVWMPPFIFLC